MFDTLNSALAFECITFMILALTIAFAVFLVKTKKETSLVIIESIVILIGTIALINILRIHWDGMQKGMTMHDWSTLSYNEIQEINDKTPTPQTPPKNRSGIIIILYAYNDPACNAIYDQLNTKIEELGIHDVYYVVDGSHNATRILNGALIETLPTIIYIRKEPLENNTNITYMSLVNETQSGFELNESVLERISLLQQQGK